ncbi:MAG: beta strand repeat-containing protein, partial [Kiritimatiellia bacterium]
MKNLLPSLLAAMLIVFATTTLAAPTGVTVNGVALDSNGSSGEGWKYYLPHITLTNAGPFTISGTNTASQVRVVVQEGVTCDVTLSNLVLETLGTDSQCAFTLETNACVSLFLAGNNALHSGDNRAGLEVPGGRTLSITNAPGDDAGALTATGGKNAAGIGGNNNNPSGTITIHGGQVTAYGTDGAAGIGGGRNADGGTTTINGGHVSASSTGTYGAGIGGGYYHAGGMITINGGTVTAQGGRHAAGIGGGYYHSGPAGTVAINGGTVTATGGANGAGIGSGGNSQGGTVSISGGTVTAQGGSSAAGIGGGQAGAGGNVAISGGRVTTTGGTSGAGIGGGGNSGAGGTVTITGGTVAATGSNGAKDIGPGQNGTVSGANIFTGGSIGLGATSAFHAPSNITAQVFCASLAGFEPGSEVTIIDLPDSFGANDIVADADGCIHLWLPNGTHNFTANGRDCTVTIQDGVAPTGVTVNGQEIATPAAPGAGWAYDAANRTLALTGAGPFTLSGTNGVGGVRVVVSSGVVNPVTLANLTLRTTGGSQCAFMLGTGANVSLVLAGTNALASGYNCAGIQVESGRTLSITHAPGDDAAALFVTGGGNAAGIGGGQAKAGGTVNIAGGAVTTAGGLYGAGIGGGGSYSSGSGAGGAVTISGGTVTATGGSRGAGIGGGARYNGTGGAGGAVTISGGAVTATGGNNGAGIGGAENGAGGTVSISGGTVFAQGSDGGMDIGPGRDTTTFGANTFAGGSIRLADASLAPIPRNHNGKAVFCATVTGFEPNERVVITDRGNLPAYYGTADIFADDDGSIHLWIPNGTYTFTANGSTYTVELDNAAGATGVTVNGDEVAFGSDDPAAGWTYDEAAGLLRLTNAGPFTISGANTEGKVRVVVNANLAPAVTLSNLTLRTSSDDRCIFTLGTGANVSLTLAGANELASGSARPGIWVQAGETLSITNAPGDDAASLAVKGGANAAGIGSGTQGAAGTVNIAGGTITATSGTCAAGIGGGQGKAGGTVNISGGTVTAVSTYSGAGIGGGMSGAGGTVNISGGTVTATGDNGGAGIGGGKNRAGGTVSISGGTVTAAGSYSAADIGPGDGSEDSGANTFTGGSILLVNDSIALAPSNNTEQVFCATLTGFTPNAAVEITGLAGYGVTDIAADDGGAIHLWLPDGEYNFTVGERYFIVTIQDGDVHVGTATGVTVNGEDVGFGPAEPTTAGWSFDLASGKLSLFGTGGLTVSGVNQAGEVCIVVPQNVTTEITISNLTLAATGNQQCPFALESGANVTLFLAGNNSLRSGDRRAGIEVATGRTLSITNAPGDDAAFLSVRGAYLGAGIGSGGSGNGGTITISGGTVEATGGSWSAGIGGGGYGDGGTVTINGGTVTATGGYNGAGIGGGDDNDGGTVTISGGVVAATGVDGGAGIGGGDKGDGGTVAISGGTVFAQGSDGGADMGPGGNGMTAAANTFTGGSIRLAAGDASLQPSNGLDPVGCAMVPGFDPGAPVVFTDHGNLPVGYGTTDIFADAGGVIYLWLPDGDYHFTANGLDCTAKIKNGTGPSGITVNGEEAAFGPSDPDNAGWSFSAATRTVSLSGTGPFTLSGANEIGGVCFAVPGGVANTVVLSNLTLRTTIADQCVFALGQDANVSLVLAGTNTLASGFGRAGIEVTTGRTLSITNAPGDDAGALRVTGGDYGAGIGGDYGGTGGTVDIHGGTVAATGGDRSAGIGGGRGGNGGTVAIHGGTVTAEGGRWGSGIGGGDYGDGGTVTIHGGTVFAQGDDYCAGIGGGDEGNGGMVTINGGTVTATS